MKIYEGPLSCDRKVKMEPEARRAYFIYRRMVIRCSNPKVKEFKYYGAKGIKVNIPVREFIGWWLLNIRKKEWKRPSVGRIDHSGNYEFGNIEMQELSDNIAESVIRGGPTHMRLVKKRREVVVGVGNAFFLFPSLKDAAVFLKIDPSNVSRFCSGQISPKNKNISVRYA